MILSSSFLHVIKLLKDNNKILSVENTDGKFRIVLRHKTNDVKKFITILTNFNMALILNCRTGKIMLKGDENIEAEVME